MHYSPVRHSPAPEGLLPSDLHVLSIPPAFNLSHDQTLQFNTNHVCAPFEMGRESCCRPPAAPARQHQPRDMSQGWRRAGRGRRLPPRINGAACAGLILTTRPPAQAPTRIILAYTVKERPAVRRAEPAYSTD
jgi:hypothetical protein